MNYMKKMIALLLCLSMTLTMIPVGAFAADEDMQESEEVFTEGEDSNRTESEEKANAYASWTDTEILAEYIRLMEAENEESLDAFVSQLSEAQQSALMVSLVAMVGDEPDTQSIVASGDCGDTGDNVRWSLDSDGTLTISGTGKMYDYSVGSESPFYNSSSIRKVVINSGVTSIGKDAFVYCSSLTSITIPNSVTSIGVSAFEGCMSLTSITLPNSVMSIGNYAFWNCSSLTNITVSEQNSKYKSVDGVLYSKDGKTLLCYPAGKSGSTYSIPSSVTSIGNYAFVYCSGLTSISIPNSVTSIGDSAFWNCSSLTSISIPNSVTSIGAGAFAFCSSLTSITLPNSVTSIGYAEFASCSSLTSISIPNSVMSIGDSAFEYCISLTSITIPNSVTSIGEGVFWECRSLTSNSIPNSVTSIGEDAFASCSSLTSISIPSSVTSIGAHAFWWCISLTSITLPNSVTSIGIGTFACCRSLTSISIPSSVTSIGSDAFSGCSSLTDVYYSGSQSQWNAISIDSDNECLTNATIHYNSTSPDSSSVGQITWKINSDGVLTISGTGPMENYDEIAVPWASRKNEIKSVIIQNGVTSIGNYAFTECKNLQNVYYGDTITSIGNCAFAMCSNLLNFNVHNGVTQIGDQAFYFCEKMSEVLISDTVLSIGYDAFEGCKSLTEISLPNSLTQIKPATFTGCSSLNSVTFSENIQSVDTGAFWNCNALKNVYYGGSQEQWNSIQIANNNNCLTGATIHFKVRSALEKLEPIHFLAFSNLAYQNWMRGELKTNGNGYLNKVWGKTDFMGNPNITGEMLYGDIANWRVACSSWDWDSSKTGFYAVTFQGETSDGVTRTVIAYRGSIGWDQIANSPYDHQDDWFFNDFPFQIGHIYTPQLQDAIDYYEYCVRELNLSKDLTVLTGHSLGGALATVVSMTYNIHAEIFNAASVFNALYYNKPAMAGKLFQGIDRWNVTAHVIDGDTFVGQWDGDYKYLPHIVYQRSSQCTSSGLFKCHGLENFLTAEKGEVKMASHSSKTQNNQIYASFTPQLTLGRSGHDLIRLADYGINKRSTIYGGDGIDTIIRAGWVNDEIVGGSVDKGWFKEIDGGLGSDIYYYFEGQGKHWIYDSEGSDVLRLFGFPGGTSVEFVKDYQLDSECNSMGAVLFNGTPLVYISMNHSGTFDIEVCQDDGTVKQSIRVDGFSWGKISKSLYVACPTTVEILDANGNIVQVLENGIDKTVRTNYGNFYVFNNEDGESVKYFDAIDGYSFRIRGVDDGTMSIAYCENEGEVYSIENVPVSTGMVATIDGGEIPLLELDSDNDGEVDSSIPLTPENGEPKFFVSLEGLNVLKGYSEVWIDGVKYPIQTGEQGRYVTVSGTEAKTLIAYDYHVGNVNDIHTHYPTGMKVHMLKYGSGGYTVTYVPQFDNILQYSGSSIRIEGNKGIRMITSIDQNKKSSLTGNGLANYRLVEYGTLLAQTSKLGSNPLVLGGANVKFNYAYKRGVADPVFNRVGNLVQYTNVLVGFNNEQCKEDIAMRPYMIVEDAQGAQYTIYGGIIYRSIGYIAYQNRNTFTIGGTAYKYVWDIIHNVYGNRYDAEYRR